METYVLNNVDYITATAEALAQSIRRKIQRPVTLIPNALEKDSLAPSQTPRQLPRGELTIGYFGHLTSS